MGNANAAVQTAQARRPDGPLDLAGEWVPARPDEWYNRLPGKHSRRARDPRTKVTYAADGTGSGQVGEVFVTYAVMPLGSGQYTATFHVQASAGVAPWSATDGNLTLLEDGTLEVRYPSYGIVEYWTRADGRGAEILRSAKAQAKAARRNSQGPARDVKLVFRHFGPKSEKQLLWHWGLGVGDAIYELNGPVAIMGPEGVIATNNPLWKAVKTQLSQFHGYLALPQTTRTTHDEIVEFSRRWVQTHPAYHVAGPNCQTFCEDLFTFLTGKNLPFAKFQERIGSRGARGPESDSRTVWLDPSKKP